VEEVDDRVDDRWMVGSHGWMVDGGWIYPYPFRSDFWFKDERCEKCEVFEQKPSNIPISKMKRYEKSVLVEIHFDHQLCQLHQLYQFQSSTVGMCIVEHGPWNS